LSGVTWDILSTAEINSRCVCVRSVYNTTENGVQWDGGR
jgi:hypothetical protein